MRGGAHLGLVEIRQAEVPNLDGEEQTTDHDDQLVDAQNSNENVVRITERALEYVLDGSVGIRNDRDTLDGEGGRPDNQNDQINRHENGHKAQQTSVGELDRRVFGLCDDLQDSERATEQRREHDHETNGQAPGDSITNCGRDVERPHDNTRVQQQRTLQDETIRTDKSTTQRYRDTNEQKEQQERRRSGLDHAVLVGQDGNDDHHHGANNHQDTRNTDNCLLRGLPVSIETS